MGNGVGKKYEQFAECLQLRDDVVLTRRLLPVLLGGTVVSGGAAAGLGLLTPSEAQAAVSDSAKSSPPPPAKVGAALAGLIAVAGALGVGIEMKKLHQSRAAYASKNCDEVIKAVQTKSEPVFDRTQIFQGLGYCSGVDALVGDCEPPRHLSNGYVWSTEPVAVRDVAVGVGVLAVGALAVYTGVAEAVALAELAASWGWVPALAL